MKMRPIMLAGVAALLPVLLASSVGVAAPVAAQARFSPPSEQLVLTRTVTRQLSGGRQLVVTRRYVIQFVSDGLGYAVNGSQLDVAVEAPPVLNGLAEIERKRVETGLFPAWVDSAGAITRKQTGPQIDKPTAAMMSSAAQSLISSSNQPTERKQEGSFYLDQLTAHPGGSPWPADLFSAAPGERRQHRVVMLPDGGQGEVDVVVRVSRLLPCGLPTAFEREITTVLEGTSRVSLERWTLELLTPEKT